MGAGSAEGAVDAANILKPLLARGEVQVVGATTLNEYRKYIEKDAALERRFSPVTVGEPTIDETIQILNGIRDKYEAHHNVKISEEAIKAAVNLSVRYINDRFLPDKAIDLMDEAASRVKTVSYTHLVHIYPEGMLRPYATDLLQFKKGAFAMAVENNVPIVPSVILTREPEGIYKYFKKKPLFTQVVLEPIYPDLTIENKGERIKKMLDEAYTKMKDQLDNNGEITYEEEEVKV